MITTVYISTAAEAFSPNDLDDLVADCRRNNSRSGITGMLLYKNGNFMQLLEGEEGPVDDLIGKLKDDPRHYGMVVLIRVPIVERCFSGWSMGFKSLSTDTTLGEALAHFDGRELTDVSFRSDPSLAVKLMLNFYKKF